MTQRKKYSTYTLRGWLEWSLPGMLFLPVGIALYWLVEWKAPTARELIFLGVWEVIFLAWTYLWKLWPFVPFGDYPDR